jgi:hypothetical protein
MAGAKLTEPHTQCQLYDRDGRGVSSIAKAAASRPGPPSPSVQPIHHPKVSGELHTINESVTGVSRPTNRFVLTLVRDIIAEP